VHMLSIAWPPKIRGGACRGTMRDGVGVVVDTMGHCIGQIVRGRVLASKMEN
jgi:hypothetical protein